MKNELDMLKEIFSHSSENVYIMNYDFEILWYSKEELSNFFGSMKIEKLLENEKKPLKSGEYFFRCSGQEFSGRIINYSDKKLYVLQMSGEDVISSYLKCRSIKEFFYNHVAQVKHFVSGISTSVFMLRKQLDNKDTNKCMEYLDVTSGNCYKLLKSVLGPSELIKYTEDMPKPLKINLTEMLEKFVDICRGILRNQIGLILNAAPELYIKADADRLTICMLSLIVAAGKNNPDCSNIVIDAEKIGNYVSVTVSARSGEKKFVQSLFSKFEKLYDSEVSDSELLIIYRFCRTYNGTFFIADEPEKGGRVYSLKFLYCNDIDDVIEFKSSSALYGTDRFSVYHVMLSEIANIM